MQRYLATPFSFLNLIVDILETLLGVRFVLKLLGAAGGNWLVHFIYAVSDPLVQPFRGIFQDIIASGARIEWATLIAMIVYGLVAILILRFIAFLADSASGNDSQHRHA